VGIGAASPLVTHSLTIGQNTGHAIADSWDTYSSRRWKTNIQTLQGALAKVEHLRGVSYDLKESGKHEVGVIAEEVGAVVPEIVSWEENGKDARGVDYSRLTALLIEATKEQQALIQRQEAQIKAQQAAAEVQQAQIASQRAQISRLLDRDAQQAHTLQTVAAQMTLLQNKLARLEGNVSDLRQASKTALAGTNGHQVAVAIAQSVRP
jgi:chromosome segregation ATPase